MMYHLRTDALRGALDEYFTGSTIKHLTGVSLAKYCLKLAPVSEQKRTVAKVEALLARVNAAWQRLAKGPAILKRFRRSVLADACSGRLTADWRGETDEPQTATALLGRIRSHRKSPRARDHSKNGKEPEQLYDLPGTWAWATLSEIGQEGRPIIYGIIKPGPHVPDGVPYVRVMEMKDGSIDVPNLRRASRERAEKFKRATLRAGDLLISKDGTIGRVAIVPPELEGGNITQHLVRVTVHELISREYVAQAIRSPAAQNWLTSEKLGVALQGVNVEDFRRLPIPTPPLAEQHEIVRRVEALFRLADAIEKQVTAATARADKLTQAILAKAFCGELVPTEAELARREGRDYEPASVLLERIRVERECAAGQSPRLPKRSGKKSVRQRKGIQP
jgi:type I restriction enzyme S subunit